MRYPVSEILEQYYKTKKHEDRHPLPDLRVDDLQRPASILRQPEFYPGLERLERLEAIADTELEIGLMAGPDSAP